MRKEKIVRYEFIMSEEEFKVFMAACEPSEFSYGYVTEGNWRDGNEQTKVTMSEKVLYEIETQLERCIAEVDTAFDFEEREITKDEWDFYYSVKRLLEELEDERDYYEEW